MRLKVRWEVFPSATPFRVGAAVLTAMGRKKSFFLKNPVLDTENGFGFRDLATRKSVVSEVPGAG